MPYARPRGRVVSPGQSQFSSGVSGLAELVSALLFKKDMQAMQQLPTAEKLYEESQTRGEWSPDLIRMFQTNPKLGHYFEAQTGRRPPTFTEVPPSRQGPPRVVSPPTQDALTRRGAGAAMQMPPSPMKTPEVPYPTDPTAYNMRLEHDQIADRTLPPHLRELKQKTDQQEFTDKAIAFGQVARWNHPLAEYLAEQAGVSLPLEPTEESPRDTNMTARINLVANLVDEYIIPGEIEYFRDFIDGTGPFPSMLNFVRRPDPATTKPSTPNYTMDAWFMKTYQAPYLQKHGGDFNAALPDMLDGLERYRIKHELPEDLTPMLDAPKPAQYEKDAKVLARYHGGLPQEWMQKLSMGVVTPEEYSVVGAHEKLTEQTKTLMKMIAIRPATGAQKKERNAAINALFELYWGPTKPGLLEQLKRSLTGFVSKKLAEADERGFPHLLLDPMETFLEFTRQLPPDVQNQMTPNRNPFGVVTPRTPEEELQDRLGLDY